MVDLHGSSVNMENLLGVRSEPANTLKETVQQQQAAIFQKILQTRRQVVNAKWITEKQRCLLVMVTVSV